MSIWQAVHPILDPALVVGGAALSVSWWARHAIRRPVELPPPPITELAETWLEHVWRTRVAGDEENGRGCLPGTTLEDVRELTTGLSGWEATIRLRPGRQTTRDAETAADMVCSAFELPAGSVIIEPTADRNQSMARLQVIQGSPLYDVRVWDPATMRLDVASGCARVGTFADGFPAHLRWFEPGSGATNLLVAGAPGSGKSQFMSLLLGISARATFTDRDGVTRPLVDTYLGCGQEGQSFPDWARSRHLRWMATTPQEITWMVHAFREMMIARSQYLTRLEWTDGQGRVRHGMPHWDPVASGLPLAQLVLDEAAAAIATNPDLAGWLLDIARRGRKNGMRVVLASQSPSADELGGNTNLRAMLSAGGVVVFRVGDGNHGSMAFPGGECGNPAEIPQVTPDGRPFQGAAFTVGPDARPRAMMRTLKITDPFGEAQAAPVTDPDPVDAAGAGRLLLEFWTRQEARWRGENPEPAELARMAKEHADAQRAALDAVVGGGDTPDSAPARPAPGSSPVGPDDRPAIRALILDAVSAAARDDRDATTAEIKKACAAWWSARSVSNELADMSRDGGPLVKVRKGVYRRATSPA
ncbi:hypothetical protein [Pseudonocardia sp. NPDC049635]|uniref:hypothetical protein n=1 Tax=Pseudonocardia sp. NPDC049635 TaxID=3155506 RepID=UPI0033E5AAE8